MDRYVTGAVIRKIRESRRMTQETLAEQLHVSSKAVSKWETGQGFPEVSLLEPLARTLGISVIELLSGEDIRNSNQASDMIKEKFYICPICGNVIRAIGEAVVICCGITLPPAEPKDMDAEHLIHVGVVEDEYYVTLDHPMNKNHCISFLAAVSDRGTQFVKLYPEENVAARFKIDRVMTLYAYCNRHGLFQAKTKDVKNSGC